MGNLSDLAMVVGTVFLWVKRDPVKWLGEGCKEGKEHLQLEAGGTWVRPTCSRKGRCSDGCVRKGKPGGAAGGEECCYSCYHCTRDVPW